MNDEVSRRTTGDECRVDAGIERSQAPAVFHRQGEEVEVREVGGRGKHGEDGIIHKG